MKTVTLVCEYNPFHFGHLHQINEIKKAFGEDTRIIAIMSGNFTQRGDLAILDKFSRARIAVENGVSLVLELPFPYSCACAESFAFGALSIAHALGAVDVLSFGSECGDTDRLTTVAKRLLSKEFNSALKQTIKNEENVACGYAALLSGVYHELYGEEDGSLLSSPNNILAIEYIKSIHRLSFPVALHTVKRVGTDEDGVQNGIRHAGATYIRALFHNECSEDAFLHLPSPSREIFTEAMENGKAPVCLNRLSCAVLSALRLGTAKEEAAECGGGLFRALQKAAFGAHDIDSLLSDVATKKYTVARQRRALLYSFFGVTPAKLAEPIGYTQVLAMDDRGAEILHDIRKTAKIGILTKPSDLHKLTAQAREQAKNAHRADSVYALASPSPRAADVFIRTSPYRK